MTRERFYTCGDTDQGSKYHYTQCGLDNVYLLSGYECEMVDGKEYVRVRHVEELWKAIGISIVSDRNDLRPQELRFLRSHMKLTQDELAKMLGVDQQTLARWEKEQSKLPGPADLAVRTLFLTSPAAQPEGNEIVVHLFKLIEEREKAEDQHFSAANFIRTMDNRDGEWRTSKETSQLQLAGM